MAESDERFAGWAILELMGHRRFAGYVTETELAGQGILRLDVPIHAAAVCTCGSTDPESLAPDDHKHDCLIFQADDEAPVDVHATQFYSPTALYCLTPTTEIVARGLAARSRPAPVQRWELPAAPVPVTTSVAPWDEEPDPDERPDEHSEAEWNELQEHDAQPLDT